MSNEDKELIMRIIAVLNTPVKVNELIPFSESIHTMMSKNDRFESLMPKLNVLGTNIKDLFNSQVGLYSYPKTSTVELRKIIIRKVKANLRTLRGSVQEMADNDLVNAIIIITAAGMAVKKLNKRQKQKNYATDGPDPGSVYLTAAGKGPHNWRISRDGVTWTVLLGSKNAAKMVTGLIEGEVYYFQNSKALFNGVEGAWSFSVRIRVK